MKAVADNSSIEWLDRAKAAFDLYRDALLRQVASKLIRPRTQYTADELRERMVAALDDPVGIDRTLKLVSPAGRQLLRLIDMSRQVRWPVGALVDLLPILGHTAGLAPVRELLEAGLLFPELTAELPVESIEKWLQQIEFDPINVITVPTVSARCRTEPLDLQLPAGEKAKLTPIEADGLEWLLRMAVVWQIVRIAPLRQTQNGGLFKRDQDRLRGVSLLATAPPDASVPPDDPALLAAELARGLGLIRGDHDEWLVGDLPASWSNGIGTALSEIWSALNGVRAWDPLRGYDPELLSRKWMPTLGIALAAALLETPPAQWLSSNELAAWLASRQPDAAREVPDLPRWCSGFLFGLLHSLHIIESATADGGWRLRLTSFGRDLLGGNGTPSPTPPIQQTLLVQPNLEVIVYRQGLTPALIAHLSRIAEWKGLGLACTLTLTPESIYRGLESGLSLSEIQRTLERHSTRPLSDSVIETLRSWASKRERVQVYPSAVLLEFRVPADLETALKEGLVEQKLTDRIGVVPSESSLDYSRFRLVGSRDYLSPEERCVEAEVDGLTMLVSDGKADLLLAAELRRFSDPIELGIDERSRHRLSVSSLQRAKDNGIDLRWLEDWFLRRSGFGIPATAKLLFQGKAAGTMAVQPIAVLRVPTQEAADGLERWTAVSGILVERLGPTTFAVREDTVDDLRRLLADAGLDCL
jgi:Helicase conserved C-terminal domain